MKNRILRVGLITSVVFLQLPSWCAAEIPAIAAPAPPTQADPVKLPYGVEDVLKLSRAQIGETIVLNYIQNSGTIYSLGPSEIIYLRDQGVSENVINAMLDQRKAVETTAQAAMQTAGQSSSGSGSPGSPSASANTFVGPNYIQTACGPVAAPLPDPPPPQSTLHIIPYPQATAAYYGHSSSPFYGPIYYGPRYPFFGAYGGYGGYCGYRSSVVYLHSGKVAPRHYRGRWH